MFKVLDLFCAGGGAGTGYYAGFSARGYEVEIVGVDIAAQPRYPFEFVQGDALDFLDRHGREFNFLHASPPCQSHTSLQQVTNKEYACFIRGTRERFRASKRSWVIENVVGAPLIDPVTLCGLSFGIPCHTHRLFETSFPLESPTGCSTKVKAQKLGRKPIAGKLLARPAGNFSGIEEYRKAFNVPWMSQAEIAQCIPPKFTEYIAHRFCDIVESY